MHTIIGPVDGDERLAEIAQGGFVCGAGVLVLLGHHDPYLLPVLQPAQGMNALIIAAGAPFWLLGQLDLGDQVADRWIPPRKLDAGCLTDQTATPVAPDE